MCEALEVLWASFSLQRMAQALRLCMFATQLLELKHLLTNCASRQSRSNVTLVHGSVIYGVAPRWVRLPLELLAIEKLNKFDKVVDTAQFEYIR